MGWTLVEVDNDGPFLFYPADAPIRGPSFDYSAVPDLVAGRQGHGPIWVTWDTNVLSLFETYGRRVWALEFNGAEGSSRTAEPVLTQHEQAEVDALVDLVTMWLGWDLRFEVLDITMEDAKRPAPPEVARRRSRSTRAVARALMLALDGEQTYPDPRDSGPPKAIVESLPEGKDRLLVAQAYRSGADVFLTCDKGILRRDARITPWGLRLLSPSALVERLVEAGLRRGFYLDYMLGVAPDLARMSALIGAVEDDGEAQA